MYDLCFYFFLFFIFGIIGWIIECTSCSIRQKKFVHDRGFLLGPYCPIYGWGALYMYIFLTRFDSNPFIVFIMAVIGTSILEYFTSYVMEKIFKARWWDYSDRKFNLRGRICLSNAIMFGVFGTLFIYFFVPFYKEFIDKIPNNLFIGICVAIFVLFVIDHIISYTIMGKIRLKLSSVRKDSTSDIDKEVKDLLNSYTYYITKIFKSFPTVNFEFPNSDRVVKSLKSALTTIDETRKEGKKKLKEIKEDIKKKI